jgi:hypothetical protein
MILIIFHSQNDNVVFYCRPNVDGVKLRGVLARALHSKDVGPEDQVPSAHGGTGRSTVLTPPR